MHELDPDTDRDPGPVTKGRTMDEMLPRKMTVHDDEQWDRVVDRMTRAGLDENLTFQFANQCWKRWRRTGFDPLALRRICREVFGEN